MDFEEILRKQFDETIDESDIEYITKQLDEYNANLAESFSLENIIESTLNGESIFNSTEIISDIRSMILYEINNSVSLIVQIIIVCIAIGLIQGMMDSLNKKNIGEISLMVVTMILMGITINCFKDIYILVEDSAEIMVNTMEIITPILMGILISTGSITSGTILSPILLGSVTGFGILIEKVILPAIYISTLLILINCLTEKDYVNKLSKLIRNLALTLTGLVIAILTGIINVQGLITEAGDGVLINATKYSLNTFIPIVGGFTSDTIELFLKCMSTIKSIVGIFGILSLVIILLGPIIKLSVIALVYKISGALLEPISNNKIAITVDQIANSIISMAAVLLFNWLIFIIFICSILSIG